MTGATARCSDGARVRSDLPVGTAAPVTRWLLVEHAGPWQRDAVASSGITRAVRYELSAAAAAAGGRVLLIRRPGRGHPSAAARLWAVADSARPTAAPVWGSWHRDRDLLAAASLLREGLPSGMADQAFDPVLLVCAHGRHDVCCAVRGRPVAAALQRIWPATTWECSHVGGDRFAANLVVLPDGVFYGNLDAASAPAVVRSHLRGETDVAHLRGLSTEPPVAQVAIAAALERWSPAPARAFRSTTLQQESPSRWTVHLAAAAPFPDAVATVVTSARAPARLTCAAPNETAALAYEVVSLSVATRAGR